MHKALCLLNHTLTQKKIRNSRKVLRFQKLYIRQKNFLKSGHRFRQVMNWIFQQSKGLYIGFSEEFVNFFKNCTLIIVKEKMEKVMTIKISKKIADYFRSSTSLVIAVNKVFSYMDISKLSGVSISIEEDEKSFVEIDERELESSVLKNEKILELVAFYAMALGE